MLKQFEVTNFKNFKETIEIDFSKVGGYQFNTECIHNQKISKMLIYGRNATGKTNLGLAIQDIKSAYTLRRKMGVYLNADSKEKKAVFKYVFQFGNDELIYKYSKISESELYEEELIVNGNRVFYFNFDKKEIDTSGLKILEADTINAEKYIEVISEDDESQEDGLQRLTFLRFLIFNTALKENSLLSQLDSFMNGISVLTVGTNIMYRPMRIYETFFTKLEEKEGLNDLEEFLNYMGITCELVLKTLPDGKKELYFKHDKLVPFFETASSGTLSLFNLYRRIVIGRNATLLFLDEFDAFYHYEMAEKLTSFLKEKYPNCQIIMTTHNTNLMTNRIMRPDCLFILSTEGKLTALCDATERELREGHNLEKLYISGNFDKYE